MFALQWWVYPIIGATVFVSVTIGMLVVNWTEDRKYNPIEHDDQVRVLIRQELASWSGECGAWIGRETDGEDLLCEHLANHEGSHGLLSDEYDQ